jgi:hypothetical protein
LVFVGRVDDQVKIRGFRVETGEVEAVLKSMPGIADAIVVARTDDAGLAFLVAYVTGSALPAPAATRAWCAGILPEYMVPRFVVGLEQLPLNANGKVDRDRLPAPGPIAAPDNSGVVAPRTDTEARCAAVLAKQLGLTAVGVTENFFELGGHSLLAVQLAAALSAAFRTEVATRLVFERPTVEGLAAAVDALLVGGYDSSGYDSSGYGRG